MWIPFIFAVDSARNPALPVSRIPIPFGTMERDLCTDT